MRTLQKSLWQLLSLALVAWLLSACGDDQDGAGEGDGGHFGSDAGTPDGPWSDVVSLDGQTSFVSAAAPPDRGTPDTGADQDGSSGGIPDPSGGGGVPRSVEEGDIYRVLDDGLLLNLNATRGLQVIDLSDLDNPRIVGALAMQGVPAEMYVVGTTAYVMLNEWRAYAGTCIDMRVQYREGGIVLAIDLSDVRAPREVAHAVLPGVIVTSRLTRSGASAALYAVVSQWEQPNLAGSSMWYAGVTVVRSFDLAGGLLQERDTLNLGGSVSAVAATPEGLVVARSDGRDDDPSQIPWYGKVSVIDISAEDGTMSEGPTAELAGTVSDSAWLHLHEGVLRVLSIARSAVPMVHYVETFDVSDARALVALDQVEVSHGEPNSAAIFLDDHLFVSSLPTSGALRAVQFDSDGLVTVLPQFPESHWSGSLRPVLSETRLLSTERGLSGNSTGLALAMYDITDPSHPSAPVQRIQLSRAGSWTEPAWPNWRFTVLEDVVQVPAADGTVETGMALVPVREWNDGTQNRDAQVRIVTFSPTTLTVRGSLSHATPVEVSTMVQDDTLLNLSGMELAIHDTSTPDSPEPRGRLDLAPYFGDVFLMGDFAVRLNGSVELVAADAPDLETASVISRFVLSGWPTVLRAGNHVAAVSLETGNVEDEDWNNDTFIRIATLDPTNPANLWRTTMIEFPTTSDGRGYIQPEFRVPCPSCATDGWMELQSPPLLLTAGAMTAVLTGVKEESLGIHIGCERRMTPYVEGCRYDSPTCETRNGIEYCETSPEGEVICYRRFKRCVKTPDQQRPVCSDYTADPSEIVRETCREVERTRTWTRVRLQPLTLQDHAAVVVGEPLELDTEFDHIGAITEGHRIYLTHTAPAVVEGDSRPWKRHFVRIIDMSDPMAPVVSEPINVPGVVFAARGDVLFTRDTVFGPNVVETAFSQLVVHEGLAWLQNQFKFDDQQVDTFILDDSGHLLVTHQLSWNLSDLGNPAAHTPQLTTLDAATLRPLGTASLDAGGELTHAASGRALFSVVGGVLMANIENPNQPFVQSWFPNIGRVSGFVRRGDQMIFAAGPYGIHQTGMDELNLRPVR